MDVGDQQLQAISFVKRSLKKLESFNIDTSLSCFCYFTSWSETPGYAKLKNNIKGSLFLFQFIKIILKNILAISSHSNYVEFNSKGSQKAYKILVLSWAFKQNFQADGSFTDRYFNENSNNLPGAHWMLISMDGYIPKNLNSNITLISNKKTFFKYDFFYLIKILISTIYNYKFSFRKIFHYFSYSSYFAKQISSIVKKELKKSSYQSILIPYEAQPFQNNVFSEIKKFDNKIKTIGYLHSLLTPLTCELYYRSGAPDLLLVHGESQIEMLKSKLDWPLQRLVLIESLRFRLNSNKSLENKIFIPLAIHNHKIYLSEFEKLLKNSSENSFPIFEIKNHPTMLNSIKHLNFKKNLEQLIQIYKNRFSEKSDKKNISIFSE